jgi:hypothetical protein
MSSQLQKRKPTTEKGFTNDEKFLCVQLCRDGLSMQKNALALKENFIANKWIKKTTTYMEVKAKKPLMALLRLNLILGLPNTPPQALDLYAPPARANIPPRRATNPNQSVPSRLLPSVAGEFVPELAGRLTRRRELTLDDFLTEASLGGGAARRRRGRPRVNK